MGRGIGLSLRGVERPCGVEECTGKYSITITSTTKRERRQEIERDTKRREAEGTNLCQRHRYPERELNEGRPHIERTFVVVLRDRKKVLVPVTDPVKGPGMHQESGPSYFDPAWNIYTQDLPLNARLTFSVTLDIPEEIEPTVNLEGRVV